MVKTKSEVKVKIKEWVSKRDEPFKTRELKEELEKFNNSIRLSPQRLQNYLRANTQAKYDKNKKLWKT